MAPASLRDAVESHRAGRLDEAEAILRALLAATPKDARAHFQLGVIALERGERAVAEERLGEATTLDPTLAEAWAQRGLLAADRGALDEAAHALDAAVALRPDEARYWNNLAAVQLAAGRASAAEKAARRSLALNPGHARTLLTLGRALGAQGDEAGAQWALQEAVRHDPAPGDAHHWLAVSCARQGRWSAALEAYRAAAERLPQGADPRIGLGHALVRLGRPREAVDAFRDAARLAPERAAAIESAALFAMQFGDGFTPGEVFEAHVRWGRRHAPSREARARDRGERGQAPPETRAPGRLRIGYVSSRFQRSSMAFALLPVLERHDRERFEIFAYAEREAHDAEGEHFKSLFDHWYETQGRDDATVAARIEADGIELLVDLAGHTPGNRLGVFALRPAPAAASWLDYFDTTGVEAIEAIVADDATLAAPLVQRFVERPVSVGPVRYPYQAPSYAPRVNPPPCVSGVPATFASFARRAKITPAALEAWAEILRRVPGSRLLLMNDTLGDASACEALRAAFGQRGVAPGRLLLRPEGAHDAMLGAILEADVILDTFPYNGGITTLEALWMGRPVVSLRGTTLVGRQGAGILGAAELDECIAASVDEYIAIAIALAADCPRVARLSAGLRERVAASPLGDAAGFTRRLENLWASLISPGTAERTP